MPVNQDDKDQEHLIEELEELRSEVARLKKAQTETMHPADDLRDNSERRRSEDALKESEERYRRITAAITDYIYTVYVENGRVVSTRHSAACEAVTGYKEEEFNANPYLWFTMVSEEDRQRVREYFDLALTREPNGPIEHRIYRKDGTLRWVVNMLVIHRDESGKIRSYDGVVSDITARKRAEEALKESEERYRLMAELTGKLVYDYDVSTGRITWHGAISQLTGFMPEDFALVDIKAWHEMVHPEDRSDTIIILDAAIQECGPYHAEYRIQRKDGSYIFVEDNGVFIPDTYGNAIRMLGSMGDISRRKRSEEALRVSEERFRSLIQNSSDVIVIINRDGHIIYESPSVKNILQYQAGYLSGKSPLDFIHPDDIAIVASALGSVYEGANPGTPTEFRFLRADNTWIHLEALGKNLLDFPGINGVVVTARDVTDRKKSEGDRFEMERRLLHAQKLESLGVMAGGIAHDFNNLLMAILGNLDLALLDLSPASRSSPFIAQAIVAARRAADLTNQMLAYSGKGMFDLKAIDMSEIVEEIARLLKASISKTVLLNLQLTKDLPMIMADPGQIQQIIMNLIVNASESISSNSGVVTITTGLKECDEEYLMNSRLKEKPKEGDYIFLEVSDTGCGMDKETQEKLFDPFFTTKFTGRGLGMAAVLGIVSGHKGAIFVNSTPAEGTRIRVLFPAENKADKPVKDKEMETEKSPSSKGMVLVVDDDEMVLGLCKDMVERLGFKVLTAADGEYAVALFNENADNIDCVILDLTMPNKDGMATFDEMMASGSDVRVIISSGYDELEVSQRFKGKGLAGFIKKPYQLENLQKELYRVLKNKKSRS
jgi:two-component system, cell cycle sensor histidine kinase and response regulator CckA